jgi:1,4-dihydroxy-2-naphthoate octaprenyltransferase
MSHSNTNVKINPWVSAFILLRVPFSVFLMPVFWLALNFADYGEDSWRVWAIGFVLHFLVYPASNGYNSWHDKDTSSIGGLANPPKVVPQLLTLVNVLDVLAVLLTVAISWVSAVILALYIISSRAYSNENVRLKNNPVYSTMIVAFMQGMGVFYIVATAVHLDFSGYLEPRYFLPALGSTFLILGSYPLTQVYQHEADRKAGDNTISLLLGVRGTFVWSGLMLLIGVSLILVALLQHIGLLYAIVFFLSTQPATIYFVVWAISCWRNAEEATFKRSMWMSALSSISLSLALSFIWYKSL